MMSSRSPRGSLSGVSSAAEVAADFEESLKDLQINNRYEITNLTIIAKENTEHAQAISRALEHHIKTASPSRKLPALYVLDSIVKNVGTPFTVYLGSDLFNTFMDAYRLVDGNTRRQMDSMLKTWKEPVPGSIDPNPVFPQHVVRPIETALIRARTAAIQSRGGTQGQALHRATATPPQLDGHFAPPLSQYQMQGQHQHLVPVQQSTPQPAHYALTQGPAQGPPVDVDSIKRDVGALVARDQAALGVNMGDVGLRARLTALLDLQKVLYSQTFGPVQLESIRSQVAKLGAVNPPPPQHTPQPVPANLQWPPPAQSSYPFHQQYMPDGHPLNTQSSLPSSTSQPIDGLQALLASVPKPAIPRLNAPTPVPYGASQGKHNLLPNHAAPPPAINGLAGLLSSLTQAGMIHSGTPAAQFPPTPAQHVAPPAPDSAASLLRSLQGLLPPASTNGAPLLRPMPLSMAGRAAPLTAASLKVFRPELVHSLYEAFPNQCSMCGRRFAATEDGKAKKGFHLDWHFRTNQRVNDPSTNRGHHRDWYMNELDWTRHQEFDASTTTADAAAAVSGAKVKAPKAPQEQTLRAPAGMTKNTCSICFEEMKSNYSEELQDWVFSNAASHNGRIVHATCLADLKSAGGASGQNALASALANANTTKRDRSATPDSTLGKRKAEVSMSGMGSRVRIE